jgi:hypothetical protein
MAATVQRADIHRLSAFGLENGPTLQGIGAFKRFPSRLPEAAFSFLASQIDGRKPRGDWPP